MAIDIYNKLIETFSNLKGSKIKQFYTELLKKNMKRVALCFNRLEKPVKALEIY